MTISGAARDIGSGWWERGAFAGFVVIYAGGLPRTVNEYSVAISLLALLGLRRGSAPEPSPLRGT